MTEEKLTSLDVEWWEAMLADTERELVASLERGDGDDLVTELEATVEVIRAAVARRRE
jgi:hypothetical protein